MSQLTTTFRGRTVAGALLFAACFLGGATPSLGGGATNLRAHPKPLETIAVADASGQGHAASGFDTSVTRPRKMLLHVTVSPDTPIHLRYQVFCRGHHDRKVRNWEFDTRSRKIRLPVLLGDPRYCFVYATGEYDNPQSDEEVGFFIRLRAREGQR